MSTTINWGIIATGSIARAFAHGLGQSRTGKACAVASRTIENARAFAQEFGITSAYGRYEDLLADASIHAVYVATPHPQHLEWAMRAIDAGKHVLVEKPIALNHADAMAIFEAAHERDVMVMEAFMYRCHPQITRLVELLKEQIIGEVRIINAHFSFRTSFKEEGRLFANEFAGGGILDVGCYTTSAARLIAGACCGKDFADPIDVKGFAHLGQTGVDEWAVGILRFERDILAQISTGITLKQEEIVRIHGTEGRITLPNPWQINRKTGDAGTIIVEKYGEKPREIAVESHATCYALEADAFAEALGKNRRQAIPPAMTIADTLGNMRTLDRWRAAVGLVYEQEKPANYRRTTARGKTLSRPQSTLMQYGKIEHVDRPVSRLIMGVDNQTSFPHVAVMFDDYFERGGNTFDTAYVYGRGLQEKLLGEWLAHRGVRNQVNVIVKGAHTPYCNPIDLTTQLDESMERLGIDTADLYIMHRDNTDIPVGEFIDVLNRHVQAGKIKAFGGSNWTLARVDEANAYAKANNLQGFSVVSNQFSLARMVKPIWRGCISAGNPESRAWLMKTQMPLLSWSSQARGFFVPGNARPDKLDNREMVEVWYSDDNFERLKRANELAEKLNVPTICVALAYVLHQPFPTFALIGPRALAETRTSFDALTIKLTEEQIGWLNLED